MRIIPQKLFQAYSNFKTAAVNSEEPDNPFDPNYMGMTEIVDARVDNDPTTPDKLVATFWNGDVSSPTNRMEFNEFQEGERLVLQYDHSQTGYKANDATSTIKLDADSGQLLSVRDDAQVFILLN